MSQHPVPPRTRRLARCFRPTAVLCAEPMVTALALLAALAAAALAAAWFARRKAELFLLQLRAGKLVVVRGDPPGLLVGDLEEALRRTPQARVTIRASRGPDRAELHVRGAAPPVEQQLRNIFGIHPLSRLRR